MVRALAEVGDTRTLWALRRVASEYRGKTSWGESVADTAQLALDRLQARSVLLRFSEPVKTAIVFVMMFAAVLFASDRVRALRSELRREVAPPVMAAVTVDATATAEGEALAAATTTAAPEPTPTTAPTATPAPITGTVSVPTGNVRRAPELGNTVIGYVNQGDELIFLGVSGDWYLVKLGSKASEGSSIEGGQGWVSRIVVNEPKQRPPQVTPVPRP